MEDIEDRFCDSVTILKAYGTTESNMSLSMETNDLGVEDCSTYRCEQNPDECFDRKKVPNTLTGLVCRDRNYSIALHPQVVLMLAQAQIHLRLEFLVTLTTVVNVCV